MFPMRARIGVEPLPMNLRGKRRRSGGFGLEDEIVLTGQFLEQALFGLLHFLFILSCPRLRARLGSEKNKSTQREANCSPINAHVASRNQSLQRAARNWAHHSIMRSRCAEARTEPHRSRFKAPMRAKKASRLSMNRLVAQAFQPA